MIPLHVTLLFLNLYNIVLQLKEKSKNIKDAKIQAAKLATEAILTKMMHETPILQQINPDNDKTSSQILTPEGPHMQTSTPQDQQIKETLTPSQATENNFITSPQAPQALISHTQQTRHMQSYNQQTMPMQQNNYMYSHQPTPDYNYNYFTSPQNSLMQQQTTSTPYLASIYSSDIPTAEEYTLHSGNKTYFPMKTYQELEEENESLKSEVASLKEQLAQKKSGDIGKWA